MRNSGFLMACFCLVMAFAMFINTPDVLGEEDSYSREDIFEICEDIIDWASSDEGFFSENLISTAGSSASDWLFIGYCRLLSTSVDEDGTGKYLQSLEEYISDMYATGNLENTKATEWQRVGLAVLAAGAEPTAFGTDAEGNSIDLVADGAYDHAKYSSLGRQGVNAWCFALILLDASGTEIPEGASYSREYIIEEILSAQLANGGFSLTGVADPDVTSIAIQALSSYYEDGTVYTFESDEETVSRTVGEAIDLALSWLSGAQLDDGDFSSYGTANAESTAQVLLALTCLGIDPQEDERFIKNGNSCLDGLLRYQTESGGFAHALDDDGNATAENGLASAQSLCGLVACYRQLSGLSGFYEFTEDEQYVAEITETEEDINETDSQNDEDDEADDEETLETVSEASDDEEELPSYFVYIISVIIICIGIISFVVMRKIGVENEKNMSE